MTTYLGPLSVSNFEPLCKLATRNASVFRIRQVSFLFFFQGGLWLTFAASIIAACYLLWKFVYIMGMAMLAGFFLGVAWVCWDFLWMPKPAPLVRGVPVSYWKSDDIRSALAGCVSTGWRVSMVDTTVPLRPPATLETTERVATLCVDLPTLLLYPRDLLAATFLHAQQEANHHQDWVRRWSAQVELCWSEMSRWLGNEERFIPRLFRWIGNFVATRAAAHRLAMDWAHVLSSDLRIAKVLTPATVARSLVWRALAAAYFEHNYWPTEWKRVRSAPAMPIGIVEEMPMRLRMEWPPPENGPRLATWLSREKHPGASTPDLVERLSNLGLDVSDPKTLDLLLPTPTPLRSFPDLWGDDTPAILEALFAELSKDNESIWRNQHESYRRAQQTLKELEARRAKGELPEDDEFNRVCALSELDGAQHIGEIVSFLRKYPAHAEASLLLGFQLLEQGDEAGLHHIQKAIQIQEKLAQPAFHLVPRLLERMGRVQEAAAFAIDTALRFDLTGIVTSERATLTETDRLLPAQLSPTQLDLLREKVASVARIQSAYLVLKKLETSAESQHLLAIQVAAPMDTSITSSLAHYDRIAKQLNLPSEIRLVLLDHTQANLRSILSKVDRAVILRR